MRQYSFIHHHCKMSIVEFTLIEQLGAVLRGENIVTHGARDSLAHTPVIPRSFHWKCGLKNRGSPSVLVF